MEDLAQPELSDNLIEQFGRQILVPGIDEQGQLNLSKRKVCIIGLGALGTVASQYLVRSGIGEVHLIDTFVLAIWISFRSTLVLVRRPRTPIPQTDTSNSLHLQPLVS